METSHLVRHREKREFWEHHIKEWEMSTLSQVKYCQANGLGIKSSQYWKRKLLARVPVSLIELPIGLGARQCSTIHLQVGSRYRIEIDKGFDPETLHCLLAVLESQ
jgi:hypothetical protein